MEHGIDSSGLMFEIQRKLIGLARVRYCVPATRASAPSPLCFLGGVLPISGFELAVTRERVERLRQFLAQWIEHSRIVGGRKPKVFAPTQIRGRNVGCPSQRDVRPVVVSVRSVICRQVLRPIWGFALGGSRCILG